jgi:two-component system, chemotaxis family, sensor kinase CheA
VIASDLSPEELQEVRLVFEAEALEDLEAAENALLLLSSSTPEEGVLRAFRALHTLKGNAAALGLADVAALSHAMESLLEAMREGRLGPSPPVARFFSSGIESLRALLRSPTSPTSASVEVAVDDATTTLRVPLEALDRMLTLGGELTVLRQRARNLLPQDRPLSSAAEDVIDEEERLAAELERGLLQARMIRLAPLLHRAPRVVEETARCSEKEVALDLEGADIEVDARIVERLSAPLTHVLRNAVAHGIERPEERARRGKCPRGRITVRAVRTARHLTLTVTDDGAGISRAAVEARAIRAGLLPPGAVISESEAHELLFRPGFSTEGTVTSSAGRGVGMDVVRQSMVALRGTVRLASEEGQGTTVTLEAPLSLSLLDAFCFRVGTTALVLPVEEVLECAAPPAEARDAVSGLFAYRGESARFLDLAAVVSGRAPSGHRRAMVMARDDEGPLGLVVDELLGRARLLFKPLDLSIVESPAVAGAAVLGTGEVALLLDATQVHRAFQRSFA